MKSRSLIQIFFNNSRTSSLGRFFLYSFNSNKISVSKISNNFYNLQKMNFSKKSKDDKNDKKNKKEKEKENINKEYENISIEQLKSNYKNKVDACLVTMKEKFYEIRIQRSNPKILDNLQITLKGKKMKLSEMATIMLKSANVLVVNPFDESHKDILIKSIENSKLDLQITTEGTGIIVTIGAITDDAKQESLMKSRKIQDSSKEELKDLRHSCMSEMKKLEKILGQDEAKRIEKAVLEIIEKASKQVEQTYKKKEEEIKSS